MNVFPRQIFEKYPNIKFQFNGSQVVPCGQMDGRTEMTKLIVAFRNFAKAQKNRMKVGGGRSKREKGERISSETSEKLLQDFTASQSRRLIFTLLPRHCNSMVITLPPQSAGYTFKHWPQTGYPDCGCHGFPGSLQGNVTVGQIMPRLLPPTAFPLQLPVLDPPFDAVYSKLPTASLSQRQRKKYINIFHVFQLCATY